MACVEKTPLASYASRVKMRHSVQAICSYPMYTVSLDLLFQMKEVQAHEQLLDQGDIVQFDTSLGKAMFVSHQWTSSQHPDPDAQQLKVLQGALHNLLRGITQVSAHPLTEFVFGKISDTFQRSLKSCPMYLWYDYFSVPQEGCSQANAIASIPAYVEKCEYFAALCPSMKHQDRSDLNQYTWASRGWCRTERMVREMSAPKALILLIESPRHLAVLPAWESNFYAPGDGEFTIEEDRHIVGQVVRDLVEIQMRSSLMRHDLPSFRFYLNHQHVRLRKSQVEPLNGLLPPRDADDEDPILAEFLYQNGFRCATERDGVGWSPIHYAVLTDDPRLVTALLVKKANPNDRTKKAGHKVWKNSPVLGIASSFGNNQVVKVLLEARADGNEALTGACLADNAETVRILLAAGADPYKRPGGFTAIDTAVALGALRALKELLVVPQPQESEVRYLLHIALIFNGGNPELIRILIEAGVDINEQYHPKSVIRYFYLYFAAKHRIFGPTRFRTLSYHHRGATPLMLSILSGYFCTAEILLRAGARIDLQNDRRYTVFDLALPSAPRSLLLAFWKRGAGNHARLSSIAQWEEMNKASGFSEPDLTGPVVEDDSDHELIVESF